MGTGIEHTLWIDSLMLTEVEESNYIPTKLCYLDNQEAPYYGESAEKQVNEGRIINYNFKVKLGDLVPGGTNRATFETESGKEVSAYELTKNFFDGVLHSIETKVGHDEKTGKFPIKIMVAEPLAFQVEGHAKNWIKNYRENIKRILSRYEIVEFLPEPFAVYQFYRYGLRIPQLMDHTKHIALIIDFGGGTFDACVIESTNKGDISLTGKHSKPLASASSPVGGFYINEVLAEYLIKRNLEGADRKKADAVLKTYKRVQKGELPLSDLNAEKQNFIQSFEKLKSNAEKYKIELSDSITNWQVNDDKDDYKKIKVLLPDNPFSQGNWSEHDFRSHEFKKVFKFEVWGKLSKIIRKVLDIAKNELKGKNITTTLISGGSSNIRWLSDLLMSEFKEELSSAKPLPLSTSFQEIVAKGLAIECARRNYESESEFVSVTYNPVKLILNPDNKGDEEKKYLSIENKIDMLNAKNGDLLPSAQSLANFIDEPIQWKVKLSHPPKNQLKYFFVRPDSSEEEEEYNCYNVENNVVYTTDSKSFDSQIRVELTISEDGTVHPRFIYKMGNKDKNIPSNIVSGSPFVIDMTYESSHEGVVGDYIGFDFGTSNSSICELTSANVKKIETRSKDDNWTGLQGSLSGLPYPASLSVRKFLDVNHNLDTATVARDAFESILAFAAYTAAAEAMAQGVLKDALKGFAHRSLGPLKDLLRKSLTSLGNKAVFSEGYKCLFTTYEDELVQAIEDFNNHKHDKLRSDQFDPQSHLSLMANVCKISMQGMYFGFCTHVEPEPYEQSSYVGSFKVSHDVQPFTETFDYSGGVHYRLDEALLYNKKTSTCLNLSPFIIWRETSDYTSPYSCIWFDKFNKDDTTLKPCDKKEQIKASEISPSLPNIYKKLVSGDLPDYIKIKSIKLKQRNVDD